MIYSPRKHFPPDIRVEKEMKALADEGHKLTILARQEPFDSPNMEELIPGHVYVKRVRIANMGLIGKIIKAFTLIEPVWFEHLESFIQNNRPDILHVHDFNILPTVINVASRLSIPVVADLHENMPAALVAYRSTSPPLRKLLHSLLLNYYIWRWHEARVLPKCTRVIVVVPEAAERLRHYGIKENKIIIVSNTEDDTTFKFDLKKADLKIIEKYRKSWVLTYIGGIAPHRGIETAIKALTHLKGTITKLKFVIVGATEDNEKQLNAFSNSLGVIDLVDIVRWQPFEKVISYIIASKVCLIPHNDFEHTQTTIPHKLFQYMICKKPVLVSDCRPLKRIVEASGAGLVFRANDEKDLAEKLAYMFQHSEELVRMGENGREASIGKFSWRHDAKRLCNMYLELEKVCK